MAQETAIEWADRSWNPVVGCSPESEGCALCYAAAFAYRFMGERPIYEGTATRAGRPPRAVFTEVLRFSERALRDPVRQTAPGDIFVNSMSDLFHPEMPDEWRDRVFEVIVEAPQHRYLILTKRPQVMARYFAERPQFAGLPQVWPGTSIENRRWVGRLDILRAIPARRRFVSAEPLLGPLGRLDLTGIDWLISGGESGPKSITRPCSVRWVRELRDQCVAAGVSFFHKQWGDWRNNPLVREAGLERAKAMEAEAAAGGHVPKGGALLDGRLWTERATW